MKSTDFLQNNRFKDYLVGTKMYRELYSSKEGIASIALSSVVTIYLTCMVEKISESHLSDYLLTLLGIILGGGFGLLGFLVGGLGILVGSISDEMISVIDKAQKFESLLGIIFRFYYDGAILMILISLCVVDYLLLILPTEFDTWLTAVFTFFTAYMFWYSLMLSVMLLGTSIRLVLLRHSINEKINK